MPEDRRPAPRWRAEAGEVVRSLGRFGPAPGPRLPLALQAGIAMAVPVVVLSALGRDDLGLLSATGAFAVLYGGRLSARERAAFVPLVAATLIAIAGAGVGAAFLGPVAVAVGLVAVALGVSALCFGWSIGPPGPLFGILVYGLSAHLADPAAAHVEPVMYLTVVAGSLVFAWLMVLAPLVRHRHRRAARRRLRALFPGPTWDAAALTLLARAAAVAVAGTALATIVDPERAYWVVSAGIAVLGVSTSRRVTLTRGVHRAVGTAVGAGLYLALTFVPLAGVVLGLVLGALQFAIELVVVRHYALALAFITPLVLLILGAAGVGGPDLALERVLDTLVGAALGLASGVIVVRRRGVRPGTTA